MSADLSRYMSEFFEGYSKKELIHRAVKTYQEAEAQSCQMNQAHQVVLRLAMSQATFYYEVMNSIEFALKFTASALIQAKDSMPAFARNTNVSEADLQQSTQVLRALERNLQVWKNELEERAVQ